MGVYPEDIYQVQIFEYKWWQYIPFYKKEVQGKESVLSLATRLREKGYTFEISQRVFFSGNLHQEWVYPAPSLLEEQIQLK